MFDPEIMCVGIGREKDAFCQKQIEPQSNWLDSEDLKVTFADSLSLCLYLPSISFFCRTAPFLILFMPPRCFDPTILTQVTDISFFICCAEPVN